MKDPLWLSYMIGTVIGVTCVFIPFLVKGNFWGIPAGALIGISGYALVKALFGG